MATRWFASFLLIASLFGVSVSQASVILGTDRVIIQAGESSSMLEIKGDAEKDYLIQSWVSNNNDTEATEFTIMPQVVVLEAGKLQNLRVLYQGTGLPDDRESRLRLNIQAVPAQTDDSGPKNALTPSFIQTINLFYRPKRLDEYDPKEIPKLLKWTVEHSSDSKYTIRVENPTPFYLNFVNLFISNRGATKSNIFGYASRMGYLAPFGNKTIEVNKKELGVLNEPIVKKQLWFVTKNDAGFSVAYFATLNQDGVGSFEMFLPPAKRGTPSDGANAIPDDSSIPSDATAQ